MENIKKYIARSRFHTIVNHGFMANASFIAFKDSAVSICVFCVLCFGYSSVSAQSAFVSTQNVASGTNGKVNYSVGQSFALRATGDNGTTINGIQQPFSIYTLGVDDGAVNIFVSVYPNPVTQWLVLKTPSDMNRKTDYSLSDMNGKLLQNQPCLETETRIDMSELKAATYILHVLSQGKTLKSFKIIKH